MTRTFVRASLLAVCLLAVAGVPGTAKSVNKNAGTSSFPFLKINIGARPVAMGGAFTGLANDATALYYNPAGLATQHRANFVSGYHNYFTDLQSGFIGYTRELAPGSVGGLFLSYLNYGDFTETDISGNVLGEFSGGDLLFGISYGRAYNERFSFGATAKLMYEKLQDYSASGIAVDLGARFSTKEVDPRDYRFEDSYTAGLMIQNLGTELSSLGEESFSLPLMLRAGGSARLKGLPMIFVGDIILPRDNDIDFAVGTEYFELKPLYLRLGWNSFGSNYRSADSDDKWAGLSMGAGFDFNKYHIAYAVTLAADLGESHRITLTGGL
jgi:hypothetical protein